MIAIPLQAELQRLFLLYSIRKRTIELDGPDGLVPGVEIAGRGEGFVFGGGEGEGVCWVFDGGSGVGGLLGSAAVMAAAEPISPGAAILLASYF